MIKYNIKLMKAIGILGCGWLGYPLAEHLLKLNFSIKGTSTTIKKLEHLKNVGINSFYIDLQKLEINNIISFLADLDLLIITIPPNRMEEQPTYKKNFETLIPFIKAAKIKKVIMMSSVSVYAPNKELINEESTNFSLEPTAKQILDAENTLLNESDFTTCIFRLGGLFGKNRRPINYIVQRGILENPELPINMIEIRDIIQFTSAIIEENFEENCIYNIVSPHYKSRLDYYTKQAEELNLILPPLGENDWAQAKKISGNKIAMQTNLPYIY